MTGMYAKANGEWAKVWPELFNAATGGLVTDVPNYNGTGETWRVHTFTSSGTLTVTSAPRPFRTLVVAGGAAGSGQNRSGGGAGGVLPSDETVLPVGHCAITVGNGSPGPGAGLGTRGQDSTISAGATVLTALGGGGQASSGPFGSGGGVGGFGTAGTGQAGTPGQGMNGGNTAAAGGAWGSAGGGGAGQAGANGGAAGAGRGGDGIATDIRGTEEWFGGGGGGSSQNGSGAGGAGGRGGGGGGQAGSGGFHGAAGAANTGGGGGAGGWFFQGPTIGHGGPGGSGVVIVAYEIAPALASPPFGIPDLAAWFDASDEAGLSESGGTVASLSSLWGLPLVLSSPPAPFTLPSTTLVNGRRAMLFNGSQGITMGPNTLLSGAAGVTAFIVWQITVPPDSTRRAFHLNTSHDVGFQRLQFAANIGALHTPTRNDAAGTVIGANTATDTTGLRISMIRAAANANNAVFRFRHTDADAAMANSASFTTYEVLPGGSLTFGANPLGTQGFIGTVGEVLVYTRRLTDAEVNQVNAALAAKWGI